MTRPLRQADAGERRSPVPDPVAPPATCTEIDKLERRRKQYREASARRRQRERKDICIYALEYRQPWLAGALVEAGFLIPDYAEGKSDSETRQIELAALDELVRRALHRFSRHR